MSQSLKDLESLFGVTAGDKKKKTKKADKPKSEALIDGKRAQNVGILLAQFKSLGSYEAVGQVSYTFSSQFQFCHNFFSTLLVFPAAFLGYLACQDSHFSF